MKKMDERSLAFKCSMKWDELDKNVDGAFCNKCSKQVFDLRDYTIEEVSSLQQKHGKICGLVAALTISSALILTSCNKQETEYIEAIGEVIHQMPANDQETISVEELDEEDQ